MTSCADDRLTNFDDVLASIHQTPIATIVTDNLAQDNPILEVNEAFIRLTGYSREESIGRNCRFLAGPGTEPEVRGSIREALAGGHAIVAELTNFRKDGSAFRNALMIAPVRDAAGEIAMYLGSQMDIGGSGLRQSRSLDRVDQLSPRLRQVLRLMAIGYRNKQIGEALGIGEKTVKMHRARLKEALGVPTLADAIRVALEAGLLLNGPVRPRSEQ